MRVSECINSEIELDFWMQIRREPERALTHLSGNIPRPSENSTIYTVAFIVY